MSINETELRRPTVHLPPHVEQTAIGTTISLRITYHTGGVGDYTTDTDTYATYLHSYPGAAVELMLPNGELTPCRHEHCHGTYENDAAATAAVVAMWTQGDRPATVAVTHDYGNGPHYGMCGLEYLVDEPADGEYEISDREHGQTEEYGDGYRAWLDYTGGDSDCRLWEFKGRYVGIWPNYTEWYADVADQSEGAFTAEELENGDIDDIELEYLDHAYVAADGRCHVISVSP